MRNEQLVGIDDLRMVEECEWRFNLVTARLLKCFADFKCSRVRGSECGERNAKLHGQICNQLRNKLVCRGVHHDLQL